MTILHHLKTLWLKKITLSKISWIFKTLIWMFTFIYLNFEWKHSNLRLRLYLLWINIIDNMIAKWLQKCYDHWYKLTYHQCSILMKFWSCHNSTKKYFMILFTVTLRPFIKVPLTHLVFRHATSQKTLRWDPPIPYTWQNNWATQYTAMFLILLVQGNLKKLNFWDA